MNPFDPATSPHRRFNPLNGTWVLVSPHRAKRPWQGKVERPVQEERPAYDAGCYLCPGNSRASGQTNPAYEGTFVFDNDFPALLGGAPTDRTSTDANEDPNQELIRIAPETGRCRVICFSPRHDLTLPLMEPSAILGVVNAWVEETEMLGQDPATSYVQIFENKGEIMGCSNPHPHGQIWASGSIPEEPRKEDERQRSYFKSHGTSLLTDYLDYEEKKNKRMICANDHFTALVPFWAVWPFETLVISKRHFGGFPEMTGEEKHALADLFRRLTTRYDNLFETSFPYSMGFHQSPTNRQSQPHWHFHAHFYPPLLRSATVKKFMVGYEMLGTSQRDITAEIAAARLRELPETHYLKE